MKRKLSALIISFLFLSAVSAQEIRLNGYSSYVFDDHVDIYASNTAYYEGRVNGGFRWGAGIEYMLETNGISLSYYRQDTHVPLTYYQNGVKSQNFDVAINWIMLGGTRYLRKNKLEPFGGAEIGMAIVHLEGPESGDLGSRTKFAWALKLGTHIFFSENVGLKLQADLYSAVQSVGGGFYFGTGGAGVGVSGYSSLLQFGLGGGLVFRFPQEK